MQAGDFHHNYYVFQQSRYKFKISDTCAYENVLNGRTASLRLKVQKCLARAKPGFSSTSMSAEANVKMPPSARDAPQAHRGFTLVMKQHQIQTCSHRPWSPNCSG